ncbi:MAG: hypothetical protein K2Z81_22305 [Cyanobacteria bacterium]|nr:hypothetical protein [Cyanobacteriota bacterium]
MFEIGVGLGVALAKYQQTMMEQQLKLQMEANKPKRRGNFASVGNKAADMDDVGGGGPVAAHHSSSHHHQSNSLVPYNASTPHDTHSTAGSNRKFF